MSGHPVPSRENQRDSRDAKVRQISAPSKEKNHKFSTISAPIVDNFSGLPCKRLTFNTPEKFKYLSVFYNIIFGVYYQRMSEDEKDDGAPVLSVLSIALEHYHLRR